MDTKTRLASMVALHAVVPVLALVVGWGLLAPTLVSSTSSIAVVIGFAVAIGTLFLVGIYIATMTVPAAKSFMEEINK